MKATEQYFPAVLFVMLYRVTLSLESVRGIVKCAHSNESYRAVLSSESYGGSCSNFFVFEILSVNSQINLLGSTFPLYSLL